ncbi:unnamed protein product [Gongylonema pulchrum]|uniref:Triacylglycerol lipase n=1 Tax=Gongylonema pulchrum TaxID=637853 RepID=A0A183DUM9_9BILA|nr:unnamed protein product [Gongylonema pulchrum]
MTMPIGSVSETNLTLSFTNKRTFACPHASSSLRSGHSTADLLPQNIDIVAAMGDSVAAGKGLWLNPEIEMRGAAFPIGGDTDIDEIISIPNVLRQFNSKLEGQSHGMGTIEQLPQSQMNCARSGAQSADMLEQAKELVRRLQFHYGPRAIRSKWLLIIITVGTDQLTACPFAYYQCYTAHWQRCECARSHSSASMKELLYSWKDVFCKLENLFNRKEKPTFALIALPFVVMPDGDDPNSFLIQKHLLLNSPQFKSEIFQECPYFRTQANRAVCRLVSSPQLSSNDSIAALMTLRRQHMRQHLLLVIAIIFVCALISVIVFGTIFYRMGLKAKRSRFDVLKGV